MELIRYRSTDGSLRCALRDDERDGDGTVRAFPAGTTIGGLLALDDAAWDESIERTAHEGDTDRIAALAAPVDGLTEVWAAGVTYRRSRDARQEESETSADVYARVYDAERPELFMKSVAWRVRADGEAIGVRRDSPINVPEPELAVVVARSGRIVGYTVCNDVSSRSIEGENPLYLPQAKIYAGSCALGPTIRLASAVPDGRALALSCTIRRGGEVAWTASANTAEIVRPLEEPVAYALHSLSFPEGLILSTGTCLVPDLPFTLLPGDEVEIAIGGVGVLRNPVVLDEQIDERVGEQSDEQIGGRLP